MAQFTGKQIKDTYKSILNIANDTGVLAAGGSAAIQVLTGNDDVTPLYLNTDRIGIGTSDPLKNLHIRGDDASFLLDEDSNHFIALDLNIIDETTNSITWDNSRDFLFGTKLTSTETILSDELMRIKASGNVGIGTDSPSGLLTLESSDVKPQIPNTAPATATPDKDQPMILYLSALFLLSSYSSKPISRSAALSSAFLDNS